MDASYFAGRLKELREQTGLTQPALAERAGLSKAGIAHLEQGEREPSWSTVIALCQALGVKPNDFIQQPAARDEPKRGRPRKAASEDSGAKGKGTAKKRKKK